MDVDDGFKRRGEQDGQDQGSTSSRLSIPLMDEFPAPIFLRGLAGRDGSRIAAQ